MSSTSLDSAKDEARGHLSDDLFDRVLSRLPASAKSEIIFGPPVERRDVTVIPVARIRYGFGFGRGGGSGPKGLGGGGEGGGGGGGVLGDPVGFIEVRGGKARFKPIATGFRLPGILVTLATVVACLTLLSASRRDT